MALPPSIAGLSMWFLIITFLYIIGLILFVKTIKTKIKNLWYLTAFSLILPTTYIFLMIGTYSDDPAPLPFSILIYVCLIFLILFTKQTFYKEKKSPYIILIGVITTILICNIIITLVNPNKDNFVIYVLSVVLFAVKMILPSFWNAFSSFKQYSALKSQNVQPWIKMRYLLGGISSISFGTLGISSFISVLAYLDNLNPDRTLLLISLLVGIILMIMYSITSFIAWTMPERLKQFFNRRYKAEDETELSEEEIMKQLKED